MNLPPHPSPLPSQELDDENWQDDAATMRAMPTGDELVAHASRVDAELQARRAALAELRGNS